jgi:hypothetical protein
MGRITATVVDFATGGGRLFAQRSHERAGCPMKNIIVILL